MSAMGQFADAPSDVRLGSWLFKEGWGSSVFQQQRRSLWAPVIAGTTSVGRRVSAR